MAYDANIDYQAKKDALKKQMETETDPTRRAALQTEYDAAEQSRLEKMASDLTAYGKYATGGELNSAAGIAATNQIGTQFQQQADNLNAYYDTAKQNASNQALSRGMARSSYVQDRMAGLDSDRAKGLSDIDATKALALQKAKAAILDNYNTTQANALATEKKEFGDNIMAYYNDYQAEINRVQNDNDTSNDWKIPILQSALNQKILAQQTAAAKASKGSGGGGGGSGGSGTTGADFSGADAYAAKGGYLGDYFAANYKALGFSSASQAEAAYNVYKVEQSAAPTGDATGGNISVDTASVLRLGYGPLSAAQLAQLVKSGVITQSVQNGKIVFSKNNSGVNRFLTR
jgi:hypothetical protein